jgi:PAS domain S-box-containing protein
VFQGNIYVNCLLSIIMGLFLRFIYLNTPCQEMILQFHNCFSALAIISGISVQIDALMVMLIYAIYETGSVIKTLFRLTENHTFYFLMAIVAGIFSRSDSNNTKGLDPDIYKAAFDELPDAVLLIHPETYIVKDCNDKAILYFGTNNKIGIKGKSIIQLIPGDLSLKEAEAVLQLKKSNSDAKEVKWLKRNGKIFYGNTSFKLIKAGKDQFILVRICDVTARINDRKINEDFCSVLHRIVNLLPLAIFLKDNEGRFVFANKMFLEKHQLSESDIIGKTEQDVSGGIKEYRLDDMSVLKKESENSVESGIAFDLKGMTHVFQTTKIPFAAEGAEPEGTLGISIDISERIKDKQLIEENRQMLMQILNLLPHYIYLKDRDGKFLFVNQSTANFYKIKPEEMIGKTDADFYPPELSKEFEQTDKEIIREGKTRIIPEELSVDNKGNTRVQNVIKIPFYLNAIDATGLLGINIDITESKMSEKALKESETKYKMLMEQASDGIYLSDQDGNIMEANPRACEMFGYEMEEFVHLNIKKLIDPKESKDAPLRIPDMRGKQSIILERRFIKRDGTPFTVELSAKLLENGRHQAIIRDITERKRIERVLKDNERKFRALIENSSEIIIIVTETFKIKFISTSVKRILGFLPESVIGKSVFEFVHAEEMDQISKIFSQTLMDPGKKYAADAMRIVNNENKFLYFEIVAVNLLTDANINGIIINFHDITKRKTTETELLNTNFELDSFVYKASHDLKAPLRSVMGLIKLAKIESKDENLNVYLDMMNKSVTSLDAFIKDLTLFSRNSRMDIEARLINFEDVISESLSNLRYMENADKVVIKKDIQIYEAFYSDITRLGTIINNLLSNAFKYHRFENNNPYINIQISANIEKATIILEDNGVGIDALHIDRIFEMFYRASDASYGSGLGLYIVKNAINKLNGSIEVESVLNQGTKFKIIIPNLINKISK